MRTFIFLSVIVFSLTFAGISTSFGQEDPTAEVICGWDKGEISDSQFLSGIENLIENKILVGFEFVQSDTYDRTKPIPDSVRKTISLYCQGKAGGVDLENAIRVLFDEGLLKVDFYNVLQVEKKNYDRPYTGTANVKLFGKLENKDPAEKISFRVTYPDGYIDDLSVVPTKDGYFENYLIIDRKSPLGTYVVSGYNHFGVYLGSVKYDLIDKETSEQKIPDWVKNTMGWFSEGLISEDEMISAIEFLISQGIIKLK